MYVRTFAGARSETSAHYNTGVGTESPQKEGVATYDVAQQN